MPGLARGGARTVGMHRSCSIPWKLLAANCLARRWDMLMRQVDGTGVGTLIGLGESAR